MKKKHICYEDNQGHCHNGCGRILNHDSARGYHGDKEYMRLLEQRVHELEAGFEAIANGDPQGWAEDNLRKIAAEFEIEEFLRLGFQHEDE
jgi:hypothetical protein